jgi:hypothetical protein
MGRRGSQAHAGRASSKRSPDERSDIRVRRHVRSRISLRSSGLRSFVCLAMNEPREALACLGGANQLAVCIGHPPPNFLDLFVGQQA